MLPSCFVLLQPFVVMQRKCHGKKQTGNKFSKLCRKTGVSILLQLLLELSLFMTAVFQRILVLTPLEVCALIFLTDALTTAACNVFPMMWQISLAMLVLLLVSSGWHVPEHLPFHSLICRTLSCMCCHVLHSTCPLVVAVAFFMLTFGKQGRLSFAPSSAAKPASCAIE